MKKFLFLLLFLPFVGFSGIIPDDILVSVWPYKYNGSNGFTKPLIADQSARNVSVSYLSDYFFSYGFPLQISSAGGVNYPVVNALYGSAVTNSVMSEFFYVQGSNGVWYSTVKACPDIVQYANVCARLYAGGYRGPGFNSVYTNASGTTFCNVRPSSVFVEVLTGTNILYRQLLLSSVSDISAGVSALSSSLSTLAPVVDNIRAVNEQIVSNTLDIIDALIGDYPEEEPTRGMKGGAKGPYNDVRTSIKSQLQAWRNQATTQLQTWKTDLADQLEAWKTSDETGYLNIRRGISNVVNQLETTAPNSTNKVPYTAYVTNYVTRVITNEIERSSKEISTNVAQAARQTRDFLRDNLIDPLFDANSPGINVNIKAPLWGQSQSAVHVHDSALDTFGISVGASLDDINQWLGDIYSQGGDANDNWQAWFDRWDGFSEFTVGWFTDWWDLLADNMDSFYSAFYTADGTRRMMLELISNPEFRADVYQGLNWFQRVEYLLGFIANVSTGTVEVADIEDDMDDQVTAFESVGTNLVSASTQVAGLFDYVTRFSTSLKNAFQSSSAPVTDGIVLLQGDTWFTSDQPLVLRVDINVQNACRLGAQCIWYCGAFVAIWLVVSWAWGKILAVCRWLWSLFDI